MPFTISSSFRVPWGKRQVPAPPSAQDTSRRTRTRERARLAQGAVRPSAALADAYRSRLTRLIRDMSQSVIDELGAAYGDQEHKIALITGDRLAYDAAAATDLQAVVRNLRRRWLSRFNKLSQDLAGYFATTAADRSDEQLRRILKKSGITVDFKQTPAVREVLRAIVNENVALIRSIPEQYLGQVEVAVMRSVAAGRDMGPLMAELRQRYGVTKRRAELIARDQNQKATGAIRDVRFREIGVTEAVWRHSHAGREPRPTHVANDGRRYPVSEGWYDPDPRVRKRIRPGELINCRCFSTPVLPGF